MATKITKEWFMAAGIRALKTFAQTALAMFTVNAAIQDIDWLRMFSVAAAAGVYSILTSLATRLPELGSDGTLQIDTSKSIDTYRLQLNEDVACLTNKKVVKLTVDPKADLSQI